MAQNKSAFPYVASTDGYL